MYTKSLIVAAVALAGQAAAFSMPSCWSNCFAKYNVTSEGALCATPLVDVVGTCIVSGCAAANASSSGSEYSSWLCTYCGHSGSNSSCPTTTSSSVSGSATGYNTTSATWTWTTATTTASSSSGVASSTGVWSTSSLTSPTSSSTLPVYTGGAALNMVGGAAMLLGGVAAGLIL